VIEDYLADGMEYVLLVHNSSTFETIADLRGARMVSHVHPDMVLLPAWLGTMLAENNLPPAPQFFAAHQLRDSLNMVVLPVFFHRMDAACVARRHWQTAVELNPQLGRDVRVLAISPKVVPILFAFRRNTVSNARKALIGSIQHISSVPAGQQIVALYQSSGFVVKTISAMKSTVEMVRQFERLPTPLAGSRKAGS
jgi:phosphonate transport system substrate-binding protein